MSSFRILDYNYTWQDNVDLTASTADANFPVSNLTSTLRCKVWRTTSNTDQTVVIDIKTSEEIDSFIMWFHPLDGCKLTSDAVITVQANATNNWTSPAVSVTATLDDDFEVASYFWSTAQEYRYWRVKITDPTNDLDYIEVGKIFLTKATQLSQCPDIGFGYGNDDLSTVTRTEYNQVYADVKPNVKSLDLNMSLLTYADWETLQDIYDRVGSTLPIAISLDTDEALYDKDRFIIYGTLSGDFNAKHRVVTYFDQSIKIKEAF